MVSGLGPREFRFTSGFGVLLGFIRGLRSIRSCKSQTFNYYPSSVCSTYLPACNPAQGVYSAEITYNYYPPSICSAYLRAKNPAKRVHSRGGRTPSLVARARRWFGVDFRQVRKAFGPRLLV